MNYNSDGFRKDLTVVFHWCDNGQCLRLGGQVLATGKGTQEKLVRVGFPSSSAQGPF